MWRLARVLLAVVVGVVVTAPAASAAPDHESWPAPDRELATLLGELWETVLETPVPENPLANFKTLYGTGFERLDKDGRVERVGGVRYTIKDGIVYDPKALLADVAAMVEAQKRARSGAQQ